MIVVLLRSQRGVHGSLLLNHSGQLNPIDFRRPIEVMASGPDGPVTPDSHSRTNGVIVLQSGHRLPATTVHGSRHLNGKDHNGLPRLSGI